MNYQQQQDFKYSNKNRHEKKLQNFNAMFEAHGKSTTHRNQSTIGQFQGDNQYKLNQRLTRKSASGLIQKFQTMKNFSPTPTEEDNDMQIEESPYKNRSKNTEIVQHLISQNKNLKEHNTFLIEEVRKHREKFKQYKAEIKQYKRKVQQLVHQNDVYKLQYLTVKQYVYQSLQKVGQQDQTESLSLSSHQGIRRRTEEQQSPVKINRNSSINSINYENQPIGMHLQSRNFTNSTNQYQNQSSQMISTEPPKSIDALVDQLNDQFEAMMYEYKTTKNIDSRRKCMEIAKQIRQLKKTQKESVNKIMTKKPNLPPQAPSINSRKTLASPPTKNLFGTGPQAHSNGKANVASKFRNSDTETNIFKYLPGRNNGPASDRQFS